MKKRILLFLHQDISEYNQSFALAKYLTDNNYEVIYCTDKEYSSFPFMENYEFHILPIPFFDLDPPKQFNSKKDYEAALEGRKRMIEHLKDWFEKDKYPDLVIYSTLLFASMIPFIKLKIPIIQCAPGLSTVTNYSVPPVFSAYIPKGFKPFDYLINFLLWSKFNRFQKREMKGHKKNLVKYFGKESVIDHPVEIMKAHGLGHGVSEWRYIIKVPQLVSVPKSFDFPGVSNLNERIFIGTSCLKPTRVPFEWDKVDLSKPIIYCAIGTHIFRKVGERMNFFRSLLKCFQNRPDLYLIISIPELDYIKDKLVPIPQNVYVSNYINQQDVLSKASVFITHGGMASVKESILYGVPMIVYPFAFDQFGDAARVKFHHLGVIGKLSYINSRKVAWQIDKMLSDKSYSDSVKEMQKLFIEENKIEISDYLESYIVSARNSLINNKKYEINAG